MLNQESNKIQKCVMLLPLALSLLATTATAADIAVGPTLGTRGVGLDVTYPIRENLNLRGTLAGLQYGRDINEGGIKYRGDMDLSSAGVIFDWYPSTSSPRLSLVALYNGNRLKARAKADEDSSDLPDFFDPIISGKMALLDPLWMFEPIEVLVFGGKPR